MCKSIENCLFKPPSFFKVIVKITFWIVLGMLSIFNILNRVEEHGNLYLLLLIEIPILLFVYFQINSTWNSKYYLNEKGLNSKQLNNKDFGNLIPWNIIKNTSTGYTKYTSYINIELTRDIQMKHRFLFVLKNKMILNTYMHSEDTEYLLKEIDIYWHRAIINNKENMKNHSLK